MKQTIAASAKSQQGVVLVIALIMLVMITMITLSTMGTTIQEEKMAGNARDRNKAFQAAEAAVQYCLGQINVNNIPVSLTPTTSGAANWEVAGNWTDNTKSTAVTISSDTFKLTSEPRCMVETLGTGTGSYRVTGRAVGGAADTVVILQATYSAE